ncbi:MAG: hypothetical protein ACOC10_10490 [Bacteroidota bacterium]
MKKNPHQINKLNAEFIKNLSKHSQENISNHPIVVKCTVSGVVLTGLLVAVGAWLFSAGMVGIEEQANANTMNTGAFIIIGLVSGSAVGGLIGNVLGIFLMLKERG